MPAGPPVEASGGVRDPPSGACAATSRKAAAGPRRARKNPHAGTPGRAT